MSNKVVKVWVKAIRRKKIFKVVVWVIGLPRLLWLYKEVGVQVEVVVPNEVKVGGKAYINMRTLPRLQFLKSMLWKSLLRLILFR